MRWMSFTSLRRWLPLLLPAAEFAWVFPWVLLLSAVFYTDGSRILTPAPVAGLLVGGYLLASAPTIERWPLLRIRLGVLALSVVLGLWAVWASHYRATPLWHPGWIWALLLAAHGALPKIPPAVIGAIAAPLLLWRGMVLGGREFSYFAAERAFRRGVVWSIGFVLLFAIYHESGVFGLAKPVATGYLLGFLFLSLVLLACARLLGIWEESRGKDPRALALNRPWLVLALAVPAMIVLLGGALGGLAGADVWPYIAPFLRPLGLLLEVAFFILFVVMSIFARAILFLWDRLIGPLPRRDPVLRQTAPIEAFRDMLRDLVDVSPEVAFRVRWGMVLLVILILSLIIMLAIARARRRPRGDADEERESVWARDSLSKGLRRLFLRRRRARMAVEDQAGTSGGQAIRMIYRRLLRAAADAGVPRRMDQTPREFQRVVEPVTPEAEDDLRALTRAYEAVRYGEHRPSGGEVGEAEHQLGRLREVFDRRSREA